MEPTPENCAEEQCYITEIREDKETGNIIYLIENNVNPDEEYSTLQYVLNMQTMELEYKS